MADTKERLQNFRIARVSTVTFFVETQLRAQISAIVQDGALVTIVASEEGLSRPIPGSRYASIEIPRKIDLLKDLFALIRLWAFFRRSAFDIVHSTTPKAGLLCSLAAKLAGVPVRLHTFTGQPWVEMNGIKRQLSKGSDKLITLLNTHCYADSHAQKAFIVENGVAAPERISVLGAGSLAGIDLQRFDPERFGDAEKCALRAELCIPPQAQVLLFVGRLARDKGIVELLAAFQKMLAKERSVYLVILGPQETDVEALLDGLSAEVRKRLVMPGFSAEPERYMSIADMLLLPSYREGFGTVVIEAAAMGVPAVCTDIYGLADAIVDGETGLLVPVKNVERLAAAIDRLLVEPDLRRRMGNNARLRVEREFSCRRVNDLVIEDYVGLLRSFKVYT